jgi:hypothetical protein
VLHFAISAVLVWLAINIAFVVLRLRATRHPGPYIHGSSATYPEAIPLSHRPGR